MTPFAKAKLVALAVFAVASTGVGIYHFGYLMPQRKCEARGFWWAGEWRRCVAPVDISLLTGRSNAEAQAAAQARAKADPAP